jgi:UDP-2,4-diacetamido-2,4,6-trideoxy-beta-L-altropyranose hydrolase
MSIAKKLISYGLEVEFVTADDKADKLICGRGLRRICLNSEWDNMELELSALKQLIVNKKARVILVDSYYATKQYLSELHDFVKVIIFDDLSQLIYPANIVINYNINAVRSFYELNSSEATTLLLGCNYVPLREEFVGINRVINNVVKNVLITTGGADIYNVAGRLLNAICANYAYQNIVFHVVVGALNHNFKMLEKEFSNNKNIILYQNVEKMSELMIGCDIAISAGGSTLYELCACGTPTISFSYADNQIPGAKEFDRFRIIKYAGDVRGKEELCFERIILGLNELCHHREHRNALSIKMQEVVDGNGTERITRVVLMLLEKMTIYK